MTEKKRKAVKVERLSRYNPEGQLRHVYCVLEELCEQYHPHLDPENLCLVWKWGWKADEDGNVKYVDAKKASDLDRELRGTEDGEDAVILLNHEVFNSGHFTEHQIRFWIDHALTSLAPKYDSDGDYVEDEKGRQCFRKRSPDVQVFSEVVARHGCLHENLATLRQVLLDNEERDRPLIAMLEGALAERDREDDEDDEPNADAAMEFDAETAEV